MPTSFLDGRVIVKTGDITEENVDAIVNAANWTLLGGGGVDGAIHRRGGPSILAACELIRKQDFPKGLPTGQAVITTGGDLAARYVIHTVGPIYGMNDGRDAELLADAYRNSLELAASHSLTSVAFPAISTGAFGYPRHEAAAIASEAIESFMAGTSTVEQVRLVFFSASDADTFARHHQFQD